MKLVVGTFVTLDGVMQAPGAPDEDRDDGFEHGGWTVPLFDEQLGEIVGNWIAKSDAVLFGRKTYETFIQHWPHVTDEDDPIATTLNRVPKYVASRTLDKVEWNNSSLIKGDVADEVAKLKEEPGTELQVPGSWNLIQTLLKHDLVDEFRLCIFPVVLGRGKRLFGDGALPAGLKLVEAKTTATGVAAHIYERSGPLEYGAVGIETEAGA